MLFFTRQRAPAGQKDLARRAVGEGFEQIVAAGADGTIHEVVNGIAEPRPRLASCRWADERLRQLGLPAHDLGRCWEIIRAGTPT